MSELSIAYLILGGLLGCGALWLLWRAVRPCWCGHSRREHDRAGRCDVCRRNSWHAA